VNTRRPYFSGPYAFKLVVFALGLVCIADAWPVAQTLFLHVPLDPNEGWNAYHASAAMAGAPLYPGPQSYLVNNYPPLSFYIVGALGRLVGDYIIAGRLISLLSFGFVCFGIFFAARRMGANTIEALFAALFFAGGLLVFSDYVGMDDPQMLAHAVAMGGFLLLLQEPRTTRSIAIAALLFVIAAFIKHNVVAMALAMTGWLLLTDKRAGARLIGFGLGFLAIALVAFRLVYGVGLPSRLISARTYSLVDFKDRLLVWLPWGLMPLIAMVLLGLSSWRDRHVRLCMFMAGFSLALGAYFLGGAGVDINVLFDADIALALGLSLAARRLSGLIPPWVTAAACVVPVMVIAWQNSAEDWQDPSTWFDPAREEASLAKLDIAFLQAHRGPAICETLSLCFWANKPAAVDMFNVGQQFKTHARSEVPLVRMIETHRFAVIVFDTDTPYPLGGKVTRAVAHHYRLDHADEIGSFYVPR